MRKLFGAVLLAVFVALPATADAGWGVRAGVAADPAALVVGAEFVLPFARVWTFNPNIEQTFGDRDMLALNVDVHYDVYGANGTNAWIGAGIAQVIPEGGDLDVGLNVFAGIGRRHGERMPYVQGKVFVLSDDSRASVILGLRF